MDGDGKAKRKRKPTANQLAQAIQKYKPKGTSMAELVKFLVNRFHRRRQKKATTAPRAAKSAAPAIPWGTPLGIALGHKEREEKSAKLSEAKAPAQTPPAQMQLVVVPDVKREIEAKDIVPYKPGDTIPHNASIIAVWKDAVGQTHQKDVTSFMAHSMKTGLRALKDEKEGKHKAEEKAKLHLDEKRKAEEKAKDAAEERRKAEEKAKHAADEKKKAVEDTKKEKEKRLKLLEQKLEHEAYARMYKTWVKKPSAEVVAAAKAARIDTHHPYGHPSSGKARSREELVKEAFEAGKHTDTGKREGVQYVKLINANPIYGSYLINLEDVQSEHADQGGDGKSRLGRSTSNEEIDKAMSEVPGFQATVPSDDSFEVKGTPNPKGVSWVMNLDTSNEPGSHWVAVLITPKSVEYSDSFGDHPTPSVQERIVAAGKRLWPDNVKTLKINKIQRQSETSSTCGFHAMKFIRDRMSGKSFIDSTGYGDSRAHSQVHAGEEGAKEFERKYPKFVQVGKGILDHPGDNMPDAVKYMLEKHGQEPVSSIVVVRTPVNSIITTILNVATLGAFKSAVAKYNYDQLFHLAIVVNGKYVLEKNATVQFSTGSRNGDRKPAVVPAGVKVADLFKRGGSAGFWLYDPRSNNCQDFIITVLSGVGALTPELRTFIKQDVIAIFADIPSYAGKLAKFVTDLGGRFEGAKDKILKFFRGRGAEEGAQKTVNEIRNTLAEDQRRLEAEAKKRGIKLNDTTMRQQENPITWLLRKVGAKRLAAWLHRKDTGQELGSGRTTIDLTKEEEEEHDEEHGVMMKRSTIPNAGNGLFATKNFRKDQVIIPYKGERLTLAAKERKYPNDDAKYLFQLGKNSFIDAADPSKSNLARYANHKPFAEANAKLTTKGNITAKKAIKAGSEIFVSYGSGFRLRGGAKLPGQYTTGLNKKLVPQEIYRGGAKLPGQYMTGLNKGPLSWVPITSGMLEPYALKKIPLL